MFKTEKKKASLYDLVDQTAAYWQVTKKEAMTGVSEFFRLALDAQDEGELYACRETINKKAEFELPHVWELIEATVGLGWLEAGRQHCATLDPELVRFL